MARSLDSAIYKALHFQVKKKATASDFGLWHWFYRRIQIIVFFSPFVNTWCWIWADKWNILTVTIDDLDQALRKAILMKTMLIITRAMIKMMLFMKVLILTRYWGRLAATMGASLATPAGLSSGALCDELWLLETLLAVQAIQQFSCLVLLHGGPGPALPAVLAYSSSSLACYSSSSGLLL